MEKNTHFHKGIKILAIIGSAFLILIIGIFIFLKLTFLKTFPTFRGEVEIGKWYDVPVKEIAYTSSKYKSGFLVTRNGGHR